MPTECDYICYYYANLGSSWRKNFAILKTSVLQATHVSWNTSISKMYFMLTTWKLNKFCLLDVWFTKIHCLYVYVPHCVFPPRDGPNLPSKSFFRKPSRLEKNHGLICIYCIEMFKSENYNYRIYCYYIIFNQASIEKAHRLLFC